MSSLSVFSKSSDGGLGRFHWWLPEIHRYSSFVVAFKRALTVMQGWKLMLALRNLAGIVKEIIFGALIKFGYDSGIIIHGVNNCEFIKY
ncbi:MAG: hypothetical protein MK188_05415 [Gammaproteobacteria bacterium]|nr:hypothetical protein [Gammaproteobacteria bacterium]